MDNLTKGFCIVDRFEENWAVMENQDGTIFNFPKKMLPQDTNEGDVVVFKVEVDPQQTFLRKMQIKQKAKDIFNE